MFWLKVTSESRMSVLRRRCAVTGGLIRFFTSGLHVHTYRGRTLTPLLLDPFYEVQGKFFGKTTSAVGRIHPVARITRRARIWGTRRSQHNKTKITKGFSLNPELFFVSFAGFCKSFPCGDPVERGRRGRPSPAGAARSPGVQKIIIRRLRRS